MQILRLFVQISIMLLVVFFGFKNGRLGNYLVPVILFLEFFIVAGFVLLVAFKMLLEKLQQN